MVQELPSPRSSEAIALCSATIQAHSKSFALASKLLPQPARDEAVVLYAWCRRADDAVDEAPVGTAAQALVQLKQELDSIYREEPQSDPVLAAFQVVVHKRAIPKHYPAELLEGMAMDVDGYRYHSRKDLLLYCYRVASVVGLMMCHVMGIRRPDAILNAAHLGAAMQLTNICRDVVEDWGRGRVYLPQDEILKIEESFCPPDDVDSVCPDGFSEVMRPVVKDTLSWADEFYASGDRGVIDLHYRSGLAILAARHIYSDIGRIIRARNWDVTAGRAFTTKGRKLVLVARSIAQILLSVPRRLVLGILGRGRYTEPGSVLTFEAMYERQTQ